MGGERLEAGGGLAMAVSQGMCCCRLIYAGAMPEIESRERGGGIAIGSLLPSPQLSVGEANSAILQALRPLGVLGAGDVYERLSAGATPPRGPSSAAARRAFMHSLRSQSDLGLWLLKQA